MQTVSTGDSLPEMSKPDFWEKIKYFNMSAAGNFTYSVIKALTEKKIRKNISIRHLLKILARVLSINRSSVVHCLKSECVIADYMYLVVCLKRAS